MNDRVRLSAVAAATISVLTLLGAVGSGCRREPPGGGERHPIAGRVVAVDVANRTITIAHGDIPGFMPAMTMPFVVLEKDAALLKAAGPGDQVSATLVGRDSRYWLEDLVVVRTRTQQPGPTPTARLREARPGQRLPEVASATRSPAGWWRSTSRTASSRSPTGTSRASCRR